MSGSRIGTSCVALALLWSIASSTYAATLWVNCGARNGLTSVGAAIKTLQTFETRGPNTINVTGACRENVVIQSLDKLTLNALNGASITDPSAGALDVVDVFDSNDVTIAGFTINGGSSGIFCGDGSLCRLTNVTCTGAVNGGGIAVFSLSRARITSVTLTNNSIGLQVGNGGNVVGDATMMGNFRGMHLVTGAMVNIAANISASQELGIFGTTNATLNCNACSVTNNAAGGVVLRQSSAARFLDGFNISNNGGAGVLLSELSSALFGSGTATGNAGGTDVVCGPQFTSARGATTGLGGGITNCAEP